MKEIPIWEKSNLTLEEAAAYSGIGINKLRELTNSKDCRFGYLTDISKKSSQFKHFDKIMCRIM